MSLLLELYILTMRRIKFLSLILLRMGAPLTTAAGDFFTFNVNGTAYTAITNGATSTLNITTLTNTLTAWLDASLPNHSVTSNATSITIEADNPGVAFTVTTLSSSTFSPGNVVNT